jgi:hypothetical protein
VYWLKQGLVLSNKTKIFLPVEQFFTSVSRIMEAITNNDYERCLTVGLCTNIISISNEM